MPHSQDHPATLPLPPCPAVINGHIGRRITPESRIVPVFGGFDFSPILAIFTLAIFNRIVVEGIIHG